MQWLGLVGQVAQGFDQHTRQKLFAEQRQHLPDLDIGALELAQFMHEAARLTACKFGILVIGTASHDPLHHAVHREGAARAQASQ